jgi:hypothetical protein
MNLICINWELFWNAVIAISTAGLFIATVVLVFLGWKQFSALNKTNKETFLHQLKDDFFTDEARSIMALLEYDLLKFSTTKMETNSEDELAFFEVIEIHNDTVRKVLHRIKTERAFISSYEMDDFILMHLEDLGFLYRKGEVGIEDIDQLFGYYIEVVWENTEIRKYINWTRGIDPDIYSNFEYVYHKLKVHTDEKRK